MTDPLHTGPGTETAESSGTGSFGNGDEACGGGLLGGPGQIPGDSETCRLSRWSCVLVKPPLADLQLHAQQSTEEWWVWPVGWAKASSVRPCRGAPRPALDLMWLHAKGPFCHKVLADVGHSPLTEEAVSERVYAGFIYIPKCRTVVSVHSCLTGTGVAARRGSAWKEPGLWMGPNASASTCRMLWLPRNPVAFCCQHQALGFLVVQPQSDMGHCPRAVQKCLHLSWPCLVLWVF